MVLDMKLLTGDGGPCSDLPSTHSLCVVRCGLGDQSWWCQMKVRTRTSGLDLFWVLGVVRAVDEIYLSTTVVVIS